MLETPPALRGSFSFNRRSLSHTIRGNRPLHGDVPLPSGFRVRSRQGRAGSTDSPIFLPRLPFVVRVFLCTIDLSYACAGWRCC